MELALSGQNCPATFRDSWAGTSILAGELEKKRGNKSLLWKSYRCRIHIVGNSPRFMAPHQLGEIYPHYHPKIVQKNHPISSWDPELLIWLVVDLPLWKMMDWKSVGMMTFHSQYDGKVNPNSMVPVNTNQISQKKHHEPLFFTTFFTTMKTGVFHGQSKHIQSTNQLNRSLGLITRFDPLFSRKVPPGSSLFASAAVSRAPSAIPRGPAQRWRSRRSLWKPKRFWLTKNDDIIVGIYMYVTVYIQYKHNMYIHIYIIIIYI